MDVIVYEIPQVAVVRIGAKEESVEAKRRDYEKRFPGEENWVAYAGSEAGTLEIAGGGRGAPERRRVCCRTVRRHARCEGRVRAGALSALSDRGLAEGVKSAAIRSMASRQGHQRALSWAQA